MATIYLNPQGDDANEGTTPTTAWRSIDRLNQWLEARPPGGHRILFRSGATFPGMIVVPGGDPDNPILVDGDEGTPFTVQPSADLGAFAARGAGGWHVRNLHGLGDGVSKVIGIEFADSGDSGEECRNILAENCGAEGFGLVGLAAWSYGGVVRDVRIRGGLFARNAVGVLIGSVDEANPRTRYIFNVELREVTAIENDWHDHDSAGFGISVNATDGARIERCQTHRNGLTSLSAGHAGLLVYCCSRVDVLHHEAVGNADPNPEHGDGQGIVLDDALDCLVAHCHTRENHCGIYVMAESRGHGSDCVIVRDNEITNNTTGMGVHADSTNVLFARNLVLADGAAPRVYKAIDIAHSGELPLRAWFADNQVRALNGAVLLEADRLDGVGFAGGEFLGDAPIYRIGGVDHPVLPAEVTA